MVTTFDAYDGFGFGIKVPMLQSIQRNFRIDSYDTYKKFAYCPMRYEMQEPSLRAPRSFVIVLIARMKPLLEYLASTLLPRTFISNAPSVGALVVISERQHLTKKTHPSPLIIHPENWAWSFRVFFLCLPILVSIISLIRC